MTETTRAPATTAWGRGLLTLLLCAALAPTGLFGQAQPTSPIVAEVFIDGNRSVPADQIKAHLRTQAGREFNRAVLQEDFNRLANSKLVRPIRVMEQPTQDGRLVLHIIVEEYPNLVQEVVYKNAHHLSQEDLEGITSIKKGLPLNPALNQKACFDIQEHYKKLGRIFSTVKLEEGGKPGDRRVVFNVTESHVVKVRNISFEGNRDLATGNRLGTQIDSSGALLGIQLLVGPFNPIILDSDVAKLQEYYWNNGYRDARVSRELLFTDDLKNVDVVFHIHEGVRYRVQDVTVEGTKLLPREQVTSILKLKKGDLYNDFIAEADVHNIADLYGWRGYKVTVEKKVFKPANLDPGLINVHYDVVEQGQAKVGPIEIKGNEVTKVRVICACCSSIPVRH